MKRHVLLGFLIVFLIGFYFFQKSKKSVFYFNEDLASTHPPSSSKQHENKNTEALAESVAAEETARIPNQIETPKSGKYAIRISKPAHSMEDEIQKRDRYLKENKAGLQFSSSDQQFTLMKLRASKEKSNAVGDRSLGHEMFPIDVQLAQKVLVDEESYPVVYRESNGRVGLLTGVILIQTYENNEAEKLAQKYPMDLQIYDSAIGLATFKVRNGEGLYEVFNEIKQKERIRSVSVEVLDSYKGF